MSRLSEGSQYPNYGATSQDTEVTFSGGNGELKSLCDNVTTNIYTINGFIKSLQGALSVLGTSRESPGLRDEISVWQLSVNDVVKTTIADVARCQSLRRTATKPQRLQVEKLTNHFEETVKKCEEVQVAVAKKARSTLPGQSANSESDQTPLIEEEERQQLQVQMQLEIENDMAAMREEGIRKIEGNVLSCNELMKELHEYVLSQAAAVDTIESNVEEGASNVVAGGEQLTAASNYLSRSRKRNLCLIILLIIVLSVLIGVIAWSSR